MPRRPQAVAVSKVKDEEVIHIDDENDQPPKKPARKSSASVKKEKEVSSGESSDDFEADDVDDEEEDFKPSAKKRKYSQDEPVTKSNGNGPRNDKNKMAFPKGVYVLCLSDQDPDEKGEPNRNKLHIWRIDNHQLLQKYERVKADDDKKYKKTNRYTGWMCEEGWKFVELKVKTKSQGEDSIVLKSYPSKAEIEAAQEKRREKDAEDEEKDDD